MDNVWKLLKSPNDWAAYCRQQLEVLNWPECDFGTPPAVYPVLVASHVTAFGKMISAFVSVADAARLVQAAPNPTSVAAVSATQHDTNKHLSALMLTVIGIMIDKGLTTDSGFETKLAAKISAVDQYAAGRHEAVLKAIEGAGQVLPVIFSGIVNPTSGDESGNAKS